VFQSDPRVLINFRVFAQQSGSADREKLIQLQKEYDALAAKSGEKSSNKRVD
jgi:hypothetical protein